MIPQSSSPLGWNFRLLLYGTMIFFAFRGLSSELDEAFGEKLYAILEEHCLDCHDEGESKGDLSLEALNLANLTPDHANWEKVVKELRHRQMPPMEKKRPREEDYETLADFLESQMDSEVARNPRPGRTDTFRRLTRTEYRNSIRDLLALELDVSSLLPEDEISHGFDNITVGGLSPTLMEQYLAAAKKISRLAIGRPVPTPRLEVFRMPMDLTQESHLDGLPLGTRGGGVVDHVFPVDGIYEARLKLFRDRYERIPGLGDIQKLDLLLDGEVVEHFTIDPPEGRYGHDEVDRHLVARFHATAGRHQLGAAFFQKTNAIKGDENQPWLASFNEERHKRSQPALYSIALTGPFESTGPGNSLARKRILGDYATIGDEDHRARQILSRLMRLAYRRPITEADLEQPYRFYKDIKENEGFESGIEMGLRAILTSVDFLFRIELDPIGLAKGEVYSISDFQLASRLSFFLWSSIPDDALLNAAENGTLSEPETLEAQVSRMLADKRADSLITNFASQWLYLRNVSSLTPDPRLFMDFDDNLRQSMRQETELFLGSIMRENRSVLDILGADYTFLNERLAKHYEIPHVYGSRFRRVSLSADSHRGGLLSQASILTLSSYADRTSPVVRGAWILENILGTPPKPPPPGVEALDEEGGSDEPQTMRERFAFHRSKKSCATCHDVIDPLGFALERFDAIGRRRVEDNGLPIDSSGELPDGSSFDDADSLQQALLKRPELFATALTEKLLTYALGRGVEYYDAPAVRKIVRGGRESDFKFSSLIQGIVQSPPFTMKTVQ